MFIKKTQTLRDKVRILNYLRMYRKNSIQMSEEKKHVSIYTRIQQVWCVTTAWVTVWLQGGKYQEKLNKKGVFGRENTFNAQMRSVLIAKYSRNTTVDTGVNEIYLLSAPWGMFDVVLKKLWLKYTRT